MSNGIKWGEPGVRWGGPEWPQWSGPAGWGRKTYGELVKMISRTPSTLVIITLDYCSRSFGVSPCLATGAPCYNTYPTCKYTSAYNNIGKDYKFSLREKSVPFPGPRPYLMNERYLSTEIKPDESITMDYRITLDFYDELDGDIGIDPYVVQRTSVQGTFWRKLKARNTNYKGRMVKIRKGFIYTGFTENDYVDYFTGVIDNIEIHGGKVSVIVKGLLTLSNTEYPKTCDGVLKNAITGASTSFVVTEKAHSTSQYTTSGYAKIESDSGKPEIIQYGAASYNSSTGETTFSALTRGQYTSLGWQAGTGHGADKTVQQVIIYDNQNIVDILKLLLNAAGITDSYIDTLNFSDQKDTWLAFANVTRVLDRPQEIKNYIKEIREQFLVSVWQGDNQKIQIRHLGPAGPGQTYYTINDAENIIDKSVWVDDNEQSRSTRVAYYYDQIAGTDGTKPDDYGGVVINIDNNAEDPKLYNEKKGKQILGTWVRGKTLADTMGQKLMRRLRDGIKIIPFDLELKDSSGDVSDPNTYLKIGDLFKLTTSAYQGVDGNPLTKIFLVLQKEQKTPGRWTFKAMSTEIEDGRWAVIAPASYDSKNYSTATDEERQYGCISDANGKMSDGTDGYRIW